jgi:hypothetical protein
MKRGVHRFSTLGFGLLVVLLGVATLGGIGHRLDGWANRDLNVGAIVALAPDLSSVAAAECVAGYGSKCADDLRSGEV